jgi:hypothetical protein
MVGPRFSRLESESGQRGMSAGWSPGWNERWGGPSPNTLVSRVRTGCSGCYGVRIGTSRACRRRRGNGCPAATAPTARASTTGPEFGARDVVCDLTQSGPQPSPPLWLCLRDVPRKPSVTRDVSRWVPWVALVVGTAASLAANVAVGGAGPIGKALAGWPAVSMLVSIKLLFALIDHTKDDQRTTIRDDQRTVPDDQRTSGPPGRRDGTTRPRPGRSPMTRRTTRRAPGPARPIGPPTRRRAPRASNPERVSGAEAGTRAICVRGRRVRVRRVSFRRRSVRARPGRRWPG